MSQFTPEIQTALAAEFEDSEVGWKPQVTTKGKQKEPITRNGVQVAGCTAHIDARAVMNRLDAVVGVGGWSDAYTVLNGKNVECTLTVFGVSKSDVGETNDGGFADAMKSAYSDALKRAAVKFGIGRYLYDMEMEWLPYDGYKITSLPGPKKQPQPPRQPEKPKQPTVNRQPPPLPPVREVPPGVHPETGEVLPLDDNLFPDVPESLRRQFHAVGAKCYGDGWDDERPRLVKHITKGKSTSSKDITRAQMEKLIEGMNKKIGARGTTQPELIEGVQAIPPYDDEHAYRNS